VETRHHKEATARATINQPPGLQHGTDLPRASAVRQVRMVRNCRTQNWHRKENKKSQTGIPAFLEFRHYHQRQDKRASSLD